MEAILFIIAGSAFISLACYARAVHLAYKHTEEELRRANQIIASLKNELNKKKQDASGIPDFLLADDPMDAILQQVGYIKNP